MRTDKLKLNKRWIVLLALFFIHCSLFFSEVQAQPKKSRVQQTQQAQQAGSMPQGGSYNGGRGGDDDVVDADYTEV